MRSGRIRRGERDKKTKIKDGRSKEGRREKLRCLDTGGLDVLVCSPVIVFLRKVMPHLRVYRSVTRTPILVFHITDQKERGAR